MKRVLLILHGAPPLREYSMTLREITSRAEGSSLGYRRYTYDRSLRRLRMLRLVEAVKFLGHRCYYYRLTGDGVLAADEIRRNLEEKIRQYERLL